MVDITLDIPKISTSDFDHIIQGKLYPRRDHFHGLYSIKKNIIVVWRLDVENCNLNLGRAGSRSKD